MKKNNQEFKKLTLQKDSVMNFFHMNNTQGGVAPNISFNVIKAAININPRRGRSVTAP